MARTRIVLETSNQRKSAIMQAADLQGETLADWIEEQVDVAIPNLTAPTIANISEPLDPGGLTQTKLIYESLSALDWSFTDDNTRYLTHDLHPYPAKFIPQIPANLIARLSMRGDLVLDPFGGSATTAVEAVRLGRRSISFDANPLSALIGRVKTGFLPPAVRADLEQLCAAIEGHMAAGVGRGSLSATKLLARFQNYVPPIPNLEKWFGDTVLGELCLIRHLIDQTTEGLARDAAYLALSRIVIRVSNQDSETRYVAVSKTIAPGFVLRAYLESMRAVSRRLEGSAKELQFGDATFLVGDSRSDLVDTIGENTVDLVVTSPPYPNATDYHLYHRFRLFWLGFDPRDLGQIEIGSHLRHQRNDTGFDEYRTDMAKVIEGCAKVLVPGRYAAFVVGDALFKGESFSTADAISELAKSSGLNLLGVINRPIHTTKRSFAKPGRRARAEQLVIFEKPNRRLTVLLSPPSYRMWPYERDLRCREIQTICELSVPDSAADKPISVELEQPQLWHLRRLTFSSQFEFVDSAKSKSQTWQRTLENGDADPAKRKDPKYATHGLHPYKGKFYPQLAKALLNISGVPLGGRLFDPYCGSGTSLLEGMLNGLEAFGCDMNPLAAKIALAKTAILTLPRDLVELSIHGIMERLAHPRNVLSDEYDQFPECTHQELKNWFPEPVLKKINWLLRHIRLAGNTTIVDFFEVILSSIVREVSDQDTSDLRIRRRKDPLIDAPVIELFRERLALQHKRIQKYWLIAGRQPGRLFSPTVIQGDSRIQKTFEELGLPSNSVDCVLTSPPYATALPYIDTDRLSLLAIMGIPSKFRSDLEETITGSREIRRSAKQAAEEMLVSKAAIHILPKGVVKEVREIHGLNTTNDVGFRRANMAALLWRYYSDMKENLVRVSSALKPGAKAFYVLGDSRTNAGGNWTQIRTCQNVALIGEFVGLKYIDSISIDVTTENYKHIKNAITENRVLVFEKL